MRIKLYEMNSLQRFKMRTERNAEVIYSYFLNKFCIPFNKMNNAVSFINEFIHRYEARRKQLGN